MCFVDFIWNAHLSHTKHIVCERNFSKQRKYKTNIRVSSQNHQAKSKQKINIKCHYAALKRNKYRRKPFELCLFCAKQFHVGICQNSFEVFLFVFFAILAIRHRMCGACVCRSISCLMLSRARNTSHTHTHKTYELRIAPKPYHLSLPRFKFILFFFFFLYINQLLTTLNTCIS